MTIQFSSIARGIVEVYHKIGVVGASDDIEFFGRKTAFETLMIVAGCEFTVYWSKMPLPKFVSEFMWRLS